MTKEVIFQVLVDVLIYKFSPSKRINFASQISAAKSSTHSNAGLPVPRQPAANAATSRSSLLDNVMSINGVSQNPPPLLQLSHPPSTSLQRHELSNNRNLLSSTTTSGSSSHAGAFSRASTVTQPTLVINNENIARDNSTSSNSKVDFVIPNPFNGNTSKLPFTTGALGTERYNHIQPEDYDSEADIFPLNQQIKLNEKMMLKTKASIKKGSHANSLAALVTPSNLSRRARPFSEAKVNSAENIDICRDYIDKILSNRPAPLDVIVKHTRDLTIVDRAVLLHELLASDSLAYQLIEPVCSFV